MSYTYTEELSSQTFNVNVRRNDLDQPATDTSFSVADAALTTVSLTSARLNAALQSAPKLSPSEAFRRVLDADPNERLARAVLRDRNGRPIAADPPEAASDPDMDPALPTKEEGSEVVRVADERGGDRFAVARALPTTEGRIVFASPVSQHLASWRRGATVLVVLLGSTVRSCSLQRAFTWPRRTSGSGALAQTGPAARASISRSIAAAVACGLGTSVAAGSFGRPRCSPFWTSPSDPGTGRSRTCKRCPPRRHDLEAIARLAVERAGDYVDVEFRMRAADGRWVWLKKRAELVEDEETGGVMLVGIAFDVTERKREAEASATADQRLRDAIEAISKLLFCGTRIINGIV